jgi:hypothetical protein
MRVPVFGHYAVLGYVFTLFVSVFELGSSTFLENGGTYQTNYVAPHSSRPTMQYSPPLFWNFMHDKSQKSADHIYTAAKGLSHVLMQILLTVH